MSAGPQAVRVFALDPTDPDVLRPPMGSFEARAVLGFRFLSLLCFGGAVLAMFRTDNPVADLQSTVFSLASLALGSLYVIESLGLVRRRPWAVAALRPMLLLAGAAGITTVVVGASEGYARLPLEAVTVIWAWLGPRAVTPVPRLGRWSAPLTVGAGALLAVLLSAAPLFGWGGTFDVHAQDLEPVLTVDCGAPGAGPPASIRLTYEWTWRSASLMPSGIDVAVAGWDGDDAQGRPLYVFDKLLASGIGVYQGLVGEQSQEMAGRVGAETRGSLRWGIRLAQQQYQPGRIVVDLRRAVDAPAQPEPLVVHAVYVHLGIWRHDATPVTCGW